MNAGTKVKIVEKRPTAKGCRQQYVAKGITGNVEWIPERADVLTVAFTADEDLAVGAEFIFEPREVDEVHIYGQEEPVDFVETRPACVRDLATGRSWRIDDWTRQLLSSYERLGAQTAEATAAVDRFNSQLQAQLISPKLPPSVSIGSASSGPLVRGGEMIAFDQATGKELGRVTDLEMTVVDDPVNEWTKRLAEQEGVAKNRALERAARAAIDLGMELELIRHAEMSGGAGESPYELRLHTARGAVSHRKRHGESWDEAVRALGL